MFYCLSVWLAIPSILLKANDWKLCSTKVFVKSGTNISNYVCSAPTWVGMVEMLLFHTTSSPSSLSPPLLPSFPPPPSHVTWGKYCGSGEKSRLQTCASKAGVFQTDQCRVIDELHPSLKGTWDRSMSESWSGLRVFFSAWWLRLSAFLSLARTSLGRGASTKEPGTLSCCPALPAVPNLVDCLVLLVYFKMRAVCCVMFLPRPDGSWNHCFLCWKAAFSGFAGHLLRLFQMSHS